jgi:hypothetical protein
MMMITVISNNEIKASFSEFVMESGGRCAVQVEWEKKHVTDLSFHLYN